MSAQYRKALPQLQDNIFLLDGGMETTLVFLENLELPHFAAFDLLSIDTGRDKIRAYFQPYVDLALHSGRGLILESPTWRASRDWGEKLGYSTDELAEANCGAISMLEEIRQHYQTPESPMVIAGCIGPRGDGYKPSARMSVDEAKDYHAEQINTFADTSADFASALTLNYVEEAIGIALAAQGASLPVVISFTTETDGRLPDGTSLKEAIQGVEEATAGSPAYYMINCAHPDHFAKVLEAGESWTRRIRGLRANASRKSHTELDESTELDRGNPRELGETYRSLRQRFSHLTVLGGCCGTDVEHIEAIASCC